ncbi:cytochrome P450 18a1-like [Paramacrobiotus metropolitanus]|uniref:cytochrome P450 18a1-like n=1 Tax=Paramacrobiotus metropolitanus TaxID=2943436 RepID=UPI002445DE86|nr:cytochrome P450 18a1-like [Paramacrobiotus metropolitanus]
MYHHSFFLALLVESEVTPYLFILTSVFFVLRRFLKFQPVSKETTQRLPGPRGLPCVGSALSLARYQSSLHLKFASMAKKYGNMFRMSLGSAEVVVLSDADLIRDAFRMEQFSARPDMLFVKEIVSGNGLILSEGALWKEQRRFALQQLRHFGMYRLAKQQDQLTEKITKEIHQFMLVLEEKQGIPLNLDSYLSSVMGNIICTIIASKRFEYSDPTFSKCLKTMEEGFRLVQLAMGINFIPFLRSIPVMNKIYLKIKRNDVDTKAFFRSLISEHAKTMEPGKTRDFVDAYLHHIQRLQKEDQDTASYFSDAQMMQCVIDLFSAGMETTKVSLQWAFLYISLNSDIQSRLQQELDAVVGTERRPTMDDLPNLPYMEATICEVLRKSSVAPLGSPHAASEDTIFKGYLIPKGTTIFPNFWAVHNDEKLWKDPKRFDPERFLVKGQVEKPPFFMPFSSGRRVCLGEQLAKAEIFLVFSTVLQRFSLSIPACDKTPDCEGVLGMTLTPKPYRLLVTKRPSASALLKPA